MAENGEVQAGLAERGDLVYSQPSDVFHSAASCYCQPICRSRRIITNGDQHAGANHSASCTRIEGEPKNLAAGRSLDFRSNDDEAAIPVELEGHSITAVPSGISPVKSIAKRLGFSAAAVR